MDWIHVNRFKTYRTMRWYRSNYLWTANPFLAKYRIRVTDDQTGPQDVLAIPCPHVPGKEAFAHRDDYLYIGTSHRGELDYRDTPMICDSSMDYAWMDPPMRDLLSYPQIRYYLANVAFRDNTAQQRKAWGGEYYGAVHKHRELYGAGPEIRAERRARPDLYSKVQLFRPPTPPFTDDVFEYIAARKKPLSQRPIDLMFSGRSVYWPRAERSHPTAHRQRLERLWPQLPGQNKVLVTYDDFLGTRKAGKKIKTYAYPFEYVDSLLASKVVVSPWGWSPWCVRDLEALACGCVVVKPECSNMLIWPDIYNPANQCMVWCDLLYFSLPDQLNYIYENLPEFQERADAGCRFVTEALYPNERLFQSWTAQLRTLLELSLSTPSLA